MIYAAILAGGIGKRVERAKIPKQFVEIGGTPIIVYTLRAFLEVQDFEAIYIAVHSEWSLYLEKLLSRYFSEKERQKLVVVYGGKERIDSFVNVMNAIIDKRAISKQDILVCHDAVRPFVKKEMILECIRATQEGNVALVCIPAEDTMYISHTKGYIDGTLDRNSLFNGQNPAGFQIETLKKVCDSVSEEDKKKITGTTQLMLQLGIKLKIVNGHTANFKITTDNDLDIADRLIRARRRKGTIELLDCTLRDGGIVVNFDFGIDKMHEILEVLENAGIKLIECGYIDEKKGTCSGKTCFDSEQSIVKTLLSGGKKEGVTYLAMIDYGTFSLEKLQDRTEHDIDGIRFAFHKEDWREAIEEAKIIVKKGYQLYVQPMVTMRYDDNEYKELIETVNAELPQAKAFYIVDSFGQMDNIHLLHKLEIADEMVLSHMKIGFHAHNNRQLAYANSLTFINYPSKHDMMLDASIMGMGKGAGNLCIELIINSLAGMGMQFETTGILKMISEYFEEQQKETPWGYSLEYYFTAVFGCTPSYIKIFSKDSRVTINDLIALLQNMPEQKRAACDRGFAAEYLNSYFRR